jgi:hypothetical protein
MPHQTFKLPANAHPDMVTLCHQNVLVSQAINAYRHGFVTYQEALELALISLGKYVEFLEEEAFGQVLRKPLTIDVESRPVEPKGAA